MLPGIGIFGGFEPVVKVLVPYLKEKGFPVHAIWALNLQDAEKLAKELSIPFYTTKVDELLLQKEVSLVLVLCPPNLHSQISVKALGIGKHVLCDPPALSQTESLKMLHAAQYYPSLITLLTLSLRFHPAFIEMKRCVDKYVGTPQLCSCTISMGSFLEPSFNWLCDEVMGGGIVTLFGSHLIDLVSYLTGQRAIRVHGVMKTFLPSTFNIKGTRRITSSDFATIQMEMDGGLFVTLNLSSQLEKGSFTQEVNLYGTKGYLRGVDGKISGLIYANQSGERDLNSKNKTETELLIYEDSNSPPSHINPTPLLPPIYMEGLLNLLSSLGDVFRVSSGEDWKISSVVGVRGATFEEGQYLQAVIEAIKNSSANSCWVKVNILTEEPDPNPTFTATVRTSTISM